jgi:3-phosphoshikimate 1-carboxyvinyltransferase
VTLLVFIKDRLWETKQTLTLTAAQRLGGEICVPGDKSISHRALMFASLARGKSQISGLLQGEDCHATLNAFRALGVTD